jgi:putative ABC transport system substrate-binding protein
MNRRAFLLSVAAASLGKPPIAHADQKLPGIGFLSPSEKSGPNHRAFVNRLAELGWIEGKTVQITWRWLGQRYETLSSVANELAAADLKVVVTQTQAVTLAMMKATQKTPIVFVGVRDPVQAGIVQSLNRPGGNVTGVTLAPTGEIVAKQFEVLKEIQPSLKRVIVLWNPDAPVQATIVEQIRSIGSSIGIVVADYRISHSGDLQRAFEKAGEGQANAVITLVDSFSFENRSLIAQLAIEKRLITSFEVDDYVKAGGLVSYGLPYLDHYARGAEFVSRILKGSLPKELPVEQPTRYQLAVNMNTAKQIGLELPVSLLARADEVIE